MPLDPLPPILPRFQILGLLGEGAAAQVFRARDTSTGLEVALKVLKGRLAAAARLHERTLREMELLETKPHPHLLRIHDRGASPVPWMALELHRGSLKDAVGSTHTLSAVDVIDMAVDVLRGLVALHEAGVVHRDVKPGNILIANDGRYILADLGIARVQDSTLTGTGQTLGSFMYMAPEQRSDAHGVDPAADQYGLGASMWFAILGRTPPDLQLLPFRPALLHALPEALRTPIQRCTHLLPEQRYPSAAAMLSELLPLASTSARTSRVQA